MHFGENILDNHEPKLPCIKMNERLINSDKLLLVTVNKLRMRHNGSVTLRSFAASKMVSSVNYAFEISYLDYHEIFGISCSCSFTSYFTVLFD